MKDCYDGECTLLLSRAATIPLDRKRLHYPSMRITAISPKGISYKVTYPGSGGSEVSSGPGPGSSSFGFRDLPTVEVGVIVVNGRTALVLHRVDKP